MPDKRDPDKRDPDKRDPDNRGIIALQLEANMSNYKLPHQNQDIRSGAIPHFMENTYFIVILGGFPSCPFSSKRISRMVWDQ